ncbi:hypothetical protein LT493_27195 [Streptomyces tricolor]|nr:hypothetical protein [Streptomyces tricolor]
MGHLQVREPPPPVSPAGSATRRRRRPRSPGAGCGRAPRPGLQVRGLAARRGQGRATALGERRRQQAGARSIIRLRWRGAGGSCRVVHRVRDVLGVHPASKARSSIASCSGQRKSPYGTPRVRPRGSPVKDTVRTRLWLCSTARAPHVVGGK